MRLIKMKKAAVALLIGLPLSILWMAQPLSAHDRDNNPPGPRGGRGTNWENPPGPAGGPGASPDRHPRYWQEHRQWCENHPHHPRCRH
jgi:hypothetical protein